MTEAATGRQVAGDHYLTMKIQPRIFTMSNQWDSDAFSCLKYLSRFERKDGLEGLRKADHFAELRHEFMPPPLLAAPKIRMQDYIEQNGFVENAKLRLALLALWDTVYMHNGVRNYTTHLRNKITDLIKTLEAAQPLG